MGVVSFKHRGNFNNTEKFMKGVSRMNLMSKLKTYGAEGVNALSAATPVDSGETASSWGYEVHLNRASVCISWTNTNIKNGIPIAILIQYGHATGTGGYVQGRDYINPAIQPIFDRIADSIWTEVTSN